VTVIDGGRIINQRPARNQVEGAIMMGVGMYSLKKRITTLRPDIRSTTTWQITAWQ
jgi:CO/xanthine dehydrogenase Mo-binding subunit